jgi:hypothetical protein
VENGIGIIVDPVRCFSHGEQAGHYLRADLVKPDSGVIIGQCARETVRLSLGNIRLRNELTLPLLYDSFSETI